MSKGKFKLANITYGNVYISMLLSQFVPPSPLPPAPRVHKSFLYAFVSIAALQRSSSVPFFLGSMHMHYYMTLVLLFLACFTLCNRR